MNFLPCLWAFCACVPFGAVMNLRGKTLIFASIGGGIGWVFYLLSSPVHSDIMQYFIATIAISIYAEMMARILKMPVTGFLLVALLPMVPGGGIYYTMEYCVIGNNAMFIETGLHTMGIAGALAMGILLVSSIVRLWTTVVTQNKRA
ncbi:threonine/serine exporter family protein [Caproiciproducens sp. R1]|uniref:threonine/serine exporter family protein n=1 Tax=Caproiciproducens sp. R1 TaxID=3435000 RepID=UPI00403468C9